MVYPVIPLEADLAEVLTVVYLHHHLNLTSHQLLCPQHLYHQHPFHQDLIPTHLDSQPLQLLVSQRLFPLDSLTHQEATSDHQGSVPHCLLVAHLSHQRPFQLPLCPTFLLHLLCLPVLHCLQPEALVLLELLVPQEQLSREVKPHHQDLKLRSSMRSTVWLTATALLLATAFAKKHTKSSVK